MGDFLKGTDFSRIPPEALALYQDGTERQYAFSAPMAEKVAQLGS